MRTVTDLLWVAKQWVRERGQMRIHRIYDTLLLLFTIWALVAVHRGHAWALFKMMDFVTGPRMTLTAVQFPQINTTLLPAQIRPAI